MTNKLEPEKVARFIHEKAITNLCSEYPATLYINGEIAKQFLRDDEFCSGVRKYLLAFHGLKFELRKHYFSFNASNTDVLDLVLFKAE